MIKLALRWYLEKTYSLLSSARLAVVLIVLILIFLLIGILIPLWSFINYTLFIALMINVLLCMLKRFPGIRERVFIERLLSLEEFPYRKEILFLSGNDSHFKNALSFIKTRIKNKGYKIYQRENGFIAIKNLYSPYGTIIFHASFLLILVGTLVSMATRFTGTVILAEGQPFTGRMEEFYTASRDLSKDEIKFLHFLLEKITPSFDVKGKITGLKARLRMIKTGSFYDIAINRPAKSGPFKIHLKGFGYTPLWILKDKKGKEIDGAFVNLIVGGERVDSFNIPQKGYSVFVKFYPDYVEEKGNPGTRSWYPKNPWFYTIVKKDEDIKFEGLIPLGRYAKFDDLCLEFREVRFWGRFIITKDRGEGVIFFAFVSGISGLIFRLLFYRREIAGILTESGGKRVLLILGSSDYYSELFRKEFEEIVDLNDFEGVK